MVTRREVIVSAGAFQSPQLVCIAASKRADAQKILADGKLGFP